MKLSNFGSSAKSEPTSQSSKDLYNGQFSHSLFRYARFRTFPCRSPQSQSCVKIEHSESINFLEEFTIALWAKPAESQPSYGKLICKQKTGEYPYAIQYNEPGEILRGTVDADARFDTPGIPNFTEWAHVALTYDGEVELLYKDGLEVARKIATGDLKQNNLELTIGSRLSSAQSFVGILDDVKLYNRALSPDEIEEVMEEIDLFAVSPSGKLASAWGQIKGE